MDPSQRVERGCCRLGSFAAVVIRSLLLLVPAAVSASAADWPRFRGPNGRGVAESSPLPDKIGPAEHVIWKTALPPGHSSPVVSRERVFVTACEGDKLFTIALDRKNGKIVKATGCHGETQYGLHIQADS